MGEKTKKLLSEVPGWIPICITIACGIFYVGQKSQEFSDRLTVVEKQVQRLDNYIADRDKHSPPQSDSGRPTW